MEEDDFEKQWRDAFEDAELKPSPLVWNELQTHLHAKKRNKIILRMTLVCLLLSFGFLSYFLLIKKDKIQYTGGEENKLNLEEKSNQIAKNKQIKEKSLETTKSTQLETSKNAEKDNQSEKTTSSKFDIENKQGKILQAITSKSKKNVGLSGEYVNTSTNFNHTNFIVPENTNSNKQETINATQSSREIITLDLLKSESNVILNNFIEDSLQKNQFKNNYKTASNQKPILPSRWALGFFVDISQFKPTYKADYQNYLQTYAKAHQLNQLNTEDFFDDLQEKNKASYNLGLRLDVSYQFSRRISLRSGLIFQNNKFTQESNAVFHNPSTNERYAFVNNMLAQNINNTNLAKTIHNHPDYQANTLDLKSLNNGSVYAINNTFQYLSIPIQLGYTFMFDNKISYTIFGGISTDMFLSHKSTQANLSENSSQDFQNHVSFKSIGLSGLLNIALQYQITPKVSLNVEAVSRIGLSNYTQSDAMLRFQPRQIGASLGLQYKF